MATQQPVDDDAINLDHDDNQTLAQTQAPLAQNAPSSHTVTTASASTSSATPKASTATTALAQLNVELRQKTFKDYDDDPSKHPKHPSTIAFENLIGCTTLELADFWFCQGSPYDHVCLARTNWREFGSIWRLGEFYSRAEFHLKLYAYVLRRMSAVGILLTRGYEVMDGGLSASDRAFALVVEAMVHNWRAMLPSITDWKARGRKRSVMIDHPRLLKAIGVVIGDAALTGMNRNGNGRDRVPMKFRVKRVLSRAEVVRSGAPIGKVVKVEEVTFFWFKDVGSQGAWETEMEVVGKGDEGLICDGKVYEI